MQILEEGEDYVWTSTSREGTFDIYVKDEPFESPDNNNEVTLMAVFDKFEAKELVKELNDFINQEE